MNARNSLLAFLFLLFLSGQIQAGTFTGRIKEISSDGNKITVYSSSKKKTEVFRIDARGLKVSINSKPGKASELSLDDLVTILTTTSGDIRKIYARKSKKNVTTKKPEKKVSDDKTMTFGSGAPSRPDNTPKGKNWTQFLGSNRTNRSSETGLLKSWSPSGPKLLWTARNLGEGYSAVSIVEGKVFTMGTRSGKEIVLALDLKNGRELWAYQSGEIFRDGQGNGPRSTPTYDNGKVYSLGASGDLSCVEASSGRKIWAQNILTTYGASNIVWGISESPLVDGEKVICTPGGSIATMVALNKQNGTPIWLAKIPSNPKAGYASAIVAEIQGKKQYINFCHNGLLSVDAKNGNPLWGNDSASNTTANCSSPIAINNSIFYASGYGTGGALLNFNGRDAKPVMAYKTGKMKNHHGGMVYLNGYVYGANEQILTCLDVKNGSVAWQDRLDGKGKGAITFADGHLYFRSEQGPMFLVEATAQRANIVSRFDQPERSNRNAWARPVVADGKLFLRDQDLLLCYDLKN